MSKCIKVYEYEKLTIGERGFKEQHFEALGRFNDRYESKYFTLLRNAVRFRNFVGVIQVNEITIEILPKIDDTQNELNKDTWHKALLQMLTECHWMQVNNHETADLKLKHNSILEAYLEIFLNECEKLIREGLVKKYRLQSANCFSLKGKLSAAKQIQFNYIHKERFFVAYSLYDKQNIYNTIIYKAIRIVKTLAKSPALKDKVGQLLLLWPELPDINVDQTLFGKISFNQKTDRYKVAIQIAQLLLLNYRPGIRTGKNDVIAILFDMNQLWEEFIYRRLKKSSLNQMHSEWHISRQLSRVFWEEDNSEFKKRIRPDIVALRNKEVIIIDTKWKTYSNKKAIDAELKQMYVYSKLWKSKHTVIVSPVSFLQAEPSQAGHFFYLNSNEMVKSETACYWLGVNILNSETQKVLRADLGDAIFKKLELAHV